MDGKGGSDLVFAHQSGTREILSPPGGFSPVIASATADGLSIQSSHSPTSPHRGEICSEGSKSHHPTLCEHIIISLYIMG